MSVSKHDSDVKTSQEIHLQVREILLSCPMVVLRKIKGGHLIGDSGGLSPGGAWEEDF